MYGGVGGGGIYIRDLTIQWKKYGNELRRMVKVNERGCWRVKWENLNSTHVFTTSRRIRMDISQSVFIVSRKVSEVDREWLKAISTSFVFFDSLSKETIPPKLSFPSCSLSLSLMPTHT